jgi:internalin A
MRESNRHIEYLRRKNIFLALLCLVMSLNLFGQTEVFIPDDNFRQCLKDSYPQAFDGDLLIVDSAKNITHIDCVQKNITSIEGIENFTTVRYLYFPYNNIQSVPDISMLKELQALQFQFNAFSSLPDISSNAKLLSLEFDYNNFTVFPDIPPNSNLTSIDFTGNKLTTIPDLSYLPNLTALKVGNNPLSSIGPVYKYMLLKTLDFGKTNLTTFPDLSQNINLEELNFSLNPQFLTWPDLTANINLTSIGCTSNNYKFIPSLSAYKKLKALYCYNNQLDNLPDLSTLTQLETLDCSNNNLSSLPDLSQTKIGSTSFSYSSLQIANNRLTFEDLIPVVVSKSYADLEYAPQTLTIQNISVQKLIGENVTINTAVDNGISTNTYIWYHDNVAIDTTTTNNITIGNLKVDDSGIYTCKISNTEIPDIIIDWGSVTLTVSVPTFSIPDVNFRQCLKESYPQMFIGDLMITDSASTITQLEYHSRNIVNIAGIENFTSLSSLDLGENQIKSLPDLSMLKELRFLQASRDQLTSLPDFSQNTKLEQLYFPFNNFSVFPDLPATPSLKNLTFSHNKLTTIPDLSQLINLNALNIGFNPLSSIGPIQNCQELRILDITNVSLTTFPDLSQNIKLEELNFSNNPQFSTWPDISANVNLLTIECNFNSSLKSIPSVSAHPKLKTLNCYNDDLVSLPDLSMLTELESFNCSFNRLASLPDLSLTKLGSDPNSTLYVFGNNLTFEDLIPIVLSKAYMELVYDPQTLPAQNITISKVVGETFSYDLGFDENVTDNTYTWYHDDVEIATMSTNAFTIDSLKSSDAGVYTCKITNTEIPDITLEWKQITLTVSCPQLPVSEKDFNVILIDASCVEGGKILINGNGNRSLEGLAFELEQVNTGNIITSASPVIHNVPDGIYQLNVINNGCSQQWPLKLLINKPNCDNPIFSPNNDGVADDYFIPYHGNAKIYDRNGVLINELSIPSVWNGTDSVGQPVPMGTYVITCNGQKEIFITIIR